MSRECPQCQQPKTLVPSGAYKKWRCRPCHYQHVLAWRASNPERHREQGRRSRLKTKYGLTPEQVDALGNECAICGSADRLTIDHCHETGRVRARLCANCNAGIGMFAEDPERLRSAAEYVTGQV